MKYFTKPRYTRKQRTTGGPQPKLVSRKTDEFVASPPHFYFSGGGDSKNRSSNSNGNKTRRASKLRIPSHNFVEFMASPPHNYKGAGNFINPKTERECYTPLQSTTTVARQFSNIVEENDLAKHLHIGGILGSGGFNHVNAAEGTGICTLKTQRKIQQFPLIWRVSQNPINQIVSSSSNSSTTAASKSKHPSNHDIEKFTEKKKRAFIEEMKIQATLSAKGVMPNIYMCGIVHGNDRNIKGDGLHTFSVMERFSGSLSGLLKDPSKSPLWEDAIHRVLAMYDIVANEKVCNVDVKPENAVVSFTASGGIDRVALIDLDSEFNINVKDKRARGNVMKIMFLLYLKKHVLKEHKKNKQQYALLTRIIQSNLDAIDDAGIETFDTILKMEDELRGTFYWYKIMELAQSLHLMRMGKTRATTRRTKL